MCGMLNFHAAPLISHTLESGRKGSLALDLSVAPTDVAETNCLSQIFDNYF